MCRLRPWRGRPIGSDGLQASRCRPDRGHRCRTLQVSSRYLAPCAEHSALFQSSLARELGATDCVNPNDVPEGKTLVQYLSEKFGGGFDYTFECVGSVGTIVSRDVAVFLTPSEALERRSRIHAFRLGSLGDRRHATKATTAYVSSAFAHCWPQVDGQYPRRYAYRTANGMAWV